jgi:hypothetical protein
MCICLQAHTGSGRSLVVISMTSNRGHAACACRYTAVQALQAGTVPAVLISGGLGHSTIHLYNSIRDHPVWHHISTQEGRFEAEVCRACVCSKALGRGVRCAACLDGAGKDVL